MDVRRAFLFEHPSLLKDLYEEIHPLNQKDKPKVHLKFLTRLKAMLAVSETELNA